MQRAKRFSIFSSTAQIKTPTMHHEARFAVLQRPDNRAILLPYANPALAMIVVLPAAIDGLAQISGSLSADALDTLVAKFLEQPVTGVTLALPRIKAGLETDLISPFKAAGLKLALSDSAEISGMTGGPPGRGRVKIGQIRHRAVIAVLEEGTEAAAATAVVGVKAISMSHPEPPAAPLIVDRPFQSYIVDTPTRAPLCQGRIADPSRFT
jgi:serpin B